MDKPVLIKGDKVRFVPERFDAGASDDYIRSVYLEGLERDGVYTVFDVNPEGNISLDVKGLEGVYFVSSLFIHLCRSCQKERVFRKGKFDKCFSCAQSESVRLHDKFVAVLSPEQVVMFEAYRKAREAFTSMVILD